MSCTAFQIDIRYLVKKQKYKLHNTNTHTHTHTILSLLFPVIIISNQYGSNNNK